MNVFYCLCLCEAKGVAQKNWAVFYICFIWSQVEFAVTVLKVLSFWCFLRNFIWKQGFFSYSRYNLLRIATVLLEMSAYFWHYLIHYTAKPQSIQHIIKILVVMFLCGCDFLNGYVFFKKSFIRLFNGQKFVSTISRIRKFSLSIAFSLLYLQKCLLHFSSYC